MCKDRKSQRESVIYRCNQGIKKISIGPSTQEPTVDGALSIRFPCLLQLSTSGRRHGVESCKGNSEMRKGTFLIVD